MNFQYHVSERKKNKTYQDIRRSVGWIVVARGLVVRLEVDMGGGLFIVLPKQM